MTQDGTTPTQKIELDEIRRHLVRESMTPPTWKGVERGVYEVDLTINGSVTVEIALHEAVLLRQIDRLLQRVVDQNRSALESMVGSDETRALLEKAWFVLEPVRCARYCDGEYKVSFPGDRTIRYTVTEWDGAILLRYDDLLKRVYSENRDPIERALHQKNRPGIASCAGERPKARRPGDGDVPEAA